MPGAWMISVVEGRSSAEESSALAAARSTSAVSLLPAPVSVASKPAAIACKATRTPTTPAIPTTTTEVAPMRSGTVLKPTRATASACRPVRISASQATNTSASATTSIGARIQIPKKAAMATPAAIVGNADRR